MLRLPEWFWVAIAVLGAGLRVDYVLGSFSAAAGIAVLAGLTLGSVRGARSIACAALLLTAAATWRPLADVVGTVFEQGYAWGGVGVAALAGALGRWPDGTLVTSLDSGRNGGGPAVRQRWRVRTVILLALAATAVIAYRGWAGPAWNPQLKLYYGAAGAMAVAIAFYYSLRLLRAPGVVLTYSACLLPRYVAGLGLLALAPAKGSSRMRS